MSYSIEQLPNKRWGIYSNNKLLATVGCYDTCRKIVEMLKTKQKLKLKIEQLSVKTEKTKKQAA